ncbi:phosphate transport system substrate-binding protein [Andreprevotia lacus DSM 23236]|jgi:phosphate transport system substrate-binding protein|uniref:Phosphate-binding protein PstS n=1 Tax=Andreprevotia lacus DSM 23236 TaxID=1121001 RepID=A0A1W1WZF5_9NEIS|nr:phosphate ABC transporter substrate-binding protein PstS [Andreprevotia lacus]SMC17116.1 phosphate transport system substrate-binding protein [Andreprevotia lacus DSM 23236]
MSYGRNLLVTFGVAAGLFTVNAMAADITGAGATFPYPLYAKWAEQYKAKTSTGLNYQSIGSGGGIKQIQAKTVDFGATDKPLTAAELDKAGLAQFPTVMGGVVPVANLEVVKGGELKLAPAVLSDIFLGKITKWNDPAIAKLNPGIKLPDQNITVVHRADGSGTTWIFTNYLSKVSTEWKEKVGNDASVSWPVGVGGKGNEGVAQYVQRIKGAIGYVEYAYAKQNKMDYTQLQNKAGNFVLPDDATFKAAAANADWKNTPGFAVVLTDQAGKEAWPITGATFILVYKKQDKPEVGHEVLKYFDWAYKEGDKTAADLDYVALPDVVKNEVRASWKQIVGADNAPVFK